MRAGEILDDRYVLDRVLGQGGMGVVWVARDRTNGERVAIKLLLDDVASGTTTAHEELRQELRQRFRREAEACMKLDHHPNVVRVLEFSAKESEVQRPYMVMELLEGASLQETLKRKRNLEPKLAARIAADVASCLTAAHAAKLIHRDLKPANIYLHRAPGMDEDQFVTKVLDFGVCKDGDSVEVASGNMQTKTGMVVGSIAYMSPQQALGSKNVDFRTDIWSVGVMLYELLTGLRAFSGDVNDIIAIYAPLLVGKGPNPPVPPPSSRTRNIPPELDAVVARCTKPKPADRYGSAEELARDLYAIAGLPMPTIAKARPSSSGKLLDLYEPAIVDSKAVPAADEERRFNHAAQTIPFKQTVDARVVAPVILEPHPSTTTPPDVNLEFVGQTQVMDPSDTDKTVRMAPKGARATLPRPPTVNEPSGDAGAGTQLMAPGASPASPTPDLSKMQRALEEHRKTLGAIPIPDLSDLEASGGTQMLMTPDVPPPKRSEPSVTTSVAMSHSMGHGHLEQTIPLDPATTTGKRRRRTSPALLVLVGAGVVAALGLAVFVGMKQPAKTTPNTTTPTQNAALPTPPMSSDATEPEAPTKVADTRTPPQAPPQAPQAPPEATQAPPEAAPSVSVAALPTSSAPKLPPGALTGKLPTSTPPPTSTTKTAKTVTTTKKEPVCTGVGLFKRCK